MFESMEFELMDSFKTSQGFSSEVNLSAEAAARVASLALRCIKLSISFIPIAIPSTCESMSIKLLTIKSYSR